MAKNCSVHPTRADVAKLAGVAPTTVSLVLNNHPKVRVLPTTRKRIQQAAKKLNYQPSGLALALVTGRTNSVGVVLYHQQNPFGFYTAGILRGLWNGIRDTGMRIITDQPTAGNGAAGMFKERIVDGMIVVAPVLEPDDEICMAAASDFPMVQVGSRFLGLEADYVDLDNTGAQKLAVQKLLELGHKKILYLSGPEDNSSAIDRKAGFKQAMAEAGLRPARNQLMTGTYLFSSGRNLADMAMDSGLDFTAIAAANDSMALGAIAALRKRNMDVPKQVSVIGINGFHEEQSLSTNLSTIIQPLDKIGTKVAELLLDRIKNGRIKPKTELIPGILHTGKTLAPPHA